MIATFLVCQFYLLLLWQFHSLINNQSMAARIPIRQKRESSDSNEKSFSGGNFKLGVMNGVESEPGEWPFMASIQFAKHQHYCGGSVWNADYILTAAHCL